MTPAIEVLNVSKVYRRYARKRQFATLKSAILDGSLLGDLNPDETFQALKGVSFSVPKGCTYGVIGRNGSGKSTLLKCVAGITRPTQGEVVVLPGHRLSYQTHARRSEHWIVVAGVATCLVDGRTVVARPGETVSIAVGQAHRVANQHDEELVIIEIQRGAYTGEDDIVRLQDDYGREAPVTAP